MQPKTITTLAALRIGDRFTYKKRVDVWQKMSETKTHCAVNQIAAYNKQPIHKYDDMKKNNTPVMFLRHTVPVPGEKIFVESLVVGDVFTTEDDITKEYTIVKEDYPFYTITQPDGSKGKAGNLLEVIFVRHAS